MQLPDFQALVERMAAEVPPQYLDGVTSVEVSQRAVRHPVYPSVYTMGECIPVEPAGDQQVSRVVLYYGSFRALAAERREFNWRAEAWETLTHELRHHLESRAHSTDLDQYDWAAEQNVRRQEGEAFDPIFYLSGESVAAGVYCVEDDVFWDFVVRGPVQQRVVFEWAGRRYGAQLPRGSLPLFLTLHGLEPAPVGEALAVIRRKPRILDLLRRRAAPTFAHARVQPER
jgi:hypothetical protein